MNIGLLWFDDDPKKSTECKIAEAAERYQQRFGALPTVCHVHRPAPPAGATDAQGAALCLVLRNGEQTPPLSVSLIANSFIRPHHYWLGQDDHADQNRPLAGTACTAPR